MTPSSLPHHVAALRAHFGDGDVHAALRYLNELTPHRFTGLYVFEDPFLANQYLIDERDPEAASAPDVPVTATYCAFTRQTGAHVGIRDSHTDPRADGHAARDDIRSYCGVPLRDEDGAVFGTICHFDHGACDISPENVALLEEMERLLWRLILAERA